jgi:hypothetical protein
LRVYQVVLIAILVGAGVPIALHRSVHGAFDIGQAVLALFLWLNFIIALWEMCLFFRIDHIRQRFDRYRTEYKGRELQRVIDFGNTRVPLSKLFSPTFWSDLWASYAVFDESYANHQSFGFFIDIGNGFSMALPTLLVLYGMTYDLLPPRVLGLVMLIINYQMWYGTLVYFVSYIYNRRYIGHTRFNIALFVGGTNGLWFTLPLWGMYAAVQMIYANSYAIFRP